MISILPLLLAPLCPAPIQAAAAQTPVTTLTYPSGAPRVEWRSVRDREGNPVFEGDFERRHANGQVAVRGRFEDGVRRRRWTAYHPNGETEWTGLYVGDRRQKAWRFQDVRGETLAEGEYTNGRRTGPWVFFGPDGEVDSAASGDYAVHDEPRATGSLNDGERYGAWVERWDDGQVRMTGTYTRGRREGDWRFHHPDGTYDPHMLSGEYRADVKVAEGVAPWRPETGDYAPPLLVPRDARRVASTLELDGDPLGLARLRPQGATGRVDWLTQVVEEHGARTLPALASSLFALDLADPGTGMKVQLALGLLERTSGGRTLTWRPGTEPEDRAHNGMQRLRLASLWALTRDVPLFWEFEVTLADMDGGEQPLGSTLLLNPAIDTRAARAETAPKGPVRWGPGREARDAAIDGGLAWLVAHRSTDGHWSAAGFRDSCGAIGSGECTGPGSPHHDVGVTGLALLALLRNGSDLSRGPHMEPLRAGAAWLIGAQDDSGWFGDALASVTGSRVDGSPPKVGPVHFLKCTTCGGDGWRSLPGQDLPCTACGGHGHIPRAPTPPTPEPARPDPAGDATGTANMYDQAIATLFLAELLQASPTAAVERTVRKAVHCIERSRNPYGAWRYDRIPRGDNDTPITCWNALALLAARDAGTDVDPEVFKGIIDWLDEATDPANGRTGYDSIGSQSARVPGINDRFETWKREPLTAQSLLVRLRLGETPKEDPNTKAQADLVIKSTPRADEEEGCDYYYWLFGTEALSRIGGRHWKKWSTALNEVVSVMRRADGDMTGSWDPFSPWGHAGGRVYSTAMMVLTLEARAAD